MFPFDLVSPLFMLGRGEPVRQRHIALCVILCPAVEGNAVVGVDLTEHLLCLGKTIVG